MNVNTVIGIALTLSIIFLFNSLNASSIEEKTGAGFLCIVSSLIVVIGFIQQYKTRKI